MRPQPAKVKKGVKSTKVKLGTRLTAYASTIYNQVVKLVRLSGLLPPSIPFLDCVKRRNRLSEVVGQHQVRVKKLLSQGLLSFKAKLKKPVTFGDILLILIVLAFIMWLFWPHRVIAEDSPTPKLKHYTQIEAITAPEQAEASYIPVETPKPVQTPVQAPQTTSTDCVTGYSTGDVYLDKIIAYESGGRSCATNPGGCFGLLQACPGAPLRVACGGDPSCQIAWFQANKTGGRSWAEVWQHELAYGWW